MTYWLMAWLLHQSHCGTLPHIGSCQWCQGLALSLFQAAPRSLSGWSGHRKWLGWWLDPSVQSGLDSRSRSVWRMFSTFFGKRGFTPTTNQYTHQIDQYDEGMFLPALESRNWSQHSQLEYQFLLWRGLWENRKTFFKNLKFQEVGML